MNRTLGRLAGVAVVTTGFIVLTPGVAYADNCSSFSDCYQTARAALAALIGLSVLIGVLLSVALDFWPGVGTVKGVIEAFTGKDLITGQELTWGERVLGIVPVLGGVVGVAAAGGKVANAADGAGDVARAAGKTGNAADLANDVARSADKAADARDVENQRRLARTDPEVAAGQWHHIGTKYGEWGEHLNPLFAKAGLTLEDIENFVFLVDHAGPHPVQYHFWVSMELQAATEGLTGQAYRKAFITRLREIAEQLTRDPGMVRKWWWL